MTAPVRVHPRVPGTAPIPAFMVYIQKSIEAAGFNGVGIVGSQIPRRATFVALD